VDPSATSTDSEATIRTPRSPARRWRGDGRIAVRAGSVVAPLHQVEQIAEDWWLIDRLRWTGRRLALRVRMEPRRLRAPIHTGSATGSGPRSRRGHAQAPVGRAGARSRSGCRPGQFRTPSAPRVASARVLTHLAVQSPDDSGRPHRSTEAYRPADFPAWGIVALHAAPPMSAERRRGRGLVPGRWRTTSLARMNLCVLECGPGRRRSAGKIAAAVQPAYEKYIRGGRVSSARWTRKPPRWPWFPRPRGRRDRVPHRLRVPRKPAGRAGEPGRPVRAEVAAASQTPSRWSPSCRPRTARRSPSRRVPDVPVRIPVSCSGSDFGTGAASCSRPGGHPLPGRRAAFPIRPAGRAGGCRPLLQRAGPGRRLDAAVRRAAAAGRSCAPRHGDIWQTTALGFTSCCPARPRSSGHPQPAGGAGEVVAVGTAM